MPGSPKKRARREAEERAKNLAAAQAASELTPSMQPSGAGMDESPASAAIPLAPAVTPMQGEVLPPSGSLEPTRTALKRAMRARAQEHAEAAIAVLVANMNNPQLAPDKRAAAANSLLEWGFGKPSADIELGAGDQVIVIRRFGEENT